MGCMHTLNGARNAVISGKELPKLDVGSKVLCEQNPDSSKIKRNVYFIK